MQGLPCGINTLYHFTVAVRKDAEARSPAKKTPNSAQKGRGKKSAAGKESRSFSPAILFWLAFVILVFGLFLFNREAISNGIQTIQNRLSSGKGIPVEEVPLPPPPVSSTIPASGTERVSPSPEPAAQAAPQTPPAKQPTTQSATLPATPSKTTPVTTPQAPPPAKSPAQDARRTAPQETQGASPPKAVQNPPAGQSTAEARDRVLYFSQVDRDGSILRIKVNRKLPVSDSPMTDVIQALIAGPNSDEKRRGLISLIPPGSAILSATVRDDTAYISFSEEFQYNSYGVEGYAGQLRQIVYTVTEFSNVKNVQILIEGRRVDYLGEGIWIGGPLTRDMF